MKRYPLEPLAGLAGCHTSALASRIGVSGSTWQEYRDLGVSHRVADRIAGRLGFHPAEVWPDWLDDAIELTKKTCVAAGCDNRFLATNGRQKYCSKRCQHREAMRRWRATPEGRAVSQIHERRYGEECREYRAKSARIRRAQRKDAA